MSPDIIDSFGVLIWVMREHGDRTYEAAGVIDAQPGETVDELVKRAADLAQPEKLARIEIVPRYGRRS